MCSKRYFGIWEKRGYHVTPVHFYEPVPNSETLGRELWERQSELVGVDMREQQQIELLAGFARDYRDEYDQFPREQTEVAHRYFVHNTQYNTVDGETLYCMIRHFKPKRIIEVGSGNTTYLAAQAIRVNEEEGAPCELVSIDPHPNDTVKGGFPGLERLIPERVQDVDAEMFDALGENDILLIDSSHQLQIGSDVRLLFLEVLPRLKPGVVVHVHDIFFPEEYPRGYVLEDHIFWNEQYLLQAFLAFNSAFEVLWCGSYMHLKRADELEQHISSYDRLATHPRSFWMKRTTAGLGIRQ